MKNFYKNIMDKIILSQKYSIKSKQLEDDVFSLLEKNDIPYEEIPGGCNSSNLGEEINCFIDYEEDDIEDIMSKIKIYLNNK